MAKQTWRPKQLLPGYNYYELGESTAGKGSDVETYNKENVSNATYYRLNDDNTITKVLPPRFYSGGGEWGSDVPYKTHPIEYSEYKKEIAKPNVFKDILDAQNAQAQQSSDVTSKLKKTYEDRLAEVTSREGTYNTLASQIAALTGRSPTGASARVAAGQPTELPDQFSAGQTFGASDIATKLNFQVSDQQILDDYNATKLNRLNRIVSDGNTQIAGINQRLETAQNLLSQLPKGDARRTASETYIGELRRDLSGIQTAVDSAKQQVTEFKPITTADQEGLRQITSFREFVKLPEERASDQLRQIDPEAYRTAVGLGRQYRQMATQELPATTTPQTEQLRQTIEQEALNQLRLGSTLGAEERRGYEQAVRAAQTARGNIAGLGPAVQEAATLGAAGEQRKLARYGAAQAFLGSGETTGAALARDVALRDALRQQRLGAAAGFIAGGPSLANLAQQRLAQQNLATQQYIQANQPMPGQFQTQGMPQQFYQTTNPAIPVQLASNAAQILGSMGDYQARTYGAQVGAIAGSYTSPFQAFGQVASGIGSILSPFKFA